MSKADYTASGQALQAQHASRDLAGDAVKRHQAFLQQRLDKLARWVTQGVKPEALIRFALLDIQQNDKLRACDPGSIYLGLLACAQTGLEPGALKGEAYLVPFKGKAQFMPGWRGLVKQARRSREVKGLWANVIREHDLFECDLGSGKPPKHIAPLGVGIDRGDVIGAYAVAAMDGGYHEVEVMDRADLDAIEKMASSRGASPAWRDWQDQMQRKSPIRRLAKRLPLGTDYYVGLAIESAQQSDKPEDATSILDVFVEGEATQAVADSARADEMRQQGEK